MNMKMKYDYLIVGAGLYGAVFAHEMKKAGKRCLVIDKRDHIAGNVYTEKHGDIHVHKYGAHIFHTNDKNIWEYVTALAEFNRYTNSPVANYKGEIFNLPFNMNTFYQMWGVVTPQEAKNKIEQQKLDALRQLAGVLPSDDEETAKRKIDAFEPSNLEEQAVMLAGTDIYEKLVKGYTQKQWGRPCTQLPGFIIKRLPVRFTYDNNYFNARFQGIPEKGYTALVEKLLEGIDVRLGVDYFEERDSLKKNGRSETFRVCTPCDYSAIMPEHYDTLFLADRLVFTGPIDRFFDYSEGFLEYRSIRFETEELETSNYQGNAVVNYTDAQTPFTRIIEHKWFTFGTNEDGAAIEGTVISREYSSEWNVNEEPYYPVNDDKNNRLYQKYKTMAEQHKHVIFGGRLGEYRYYDMDQVIAAALQKVEDEDKKD